MAVADLTKGPKEFVSGIDNVVIVNYFDGIRGGRTLDVADYPLDTIQAGHLIIKKSDGSFAPMPVAKTSDEYDKYDSLPGSASYAGYLVATISKDKPFAAIMVRGTVNPKAAPFDLSTVLEDVKAALPLIDYQED